mmetsp:Transcript_65134/g.181090  ORF Transcript_65134/g.181090 Transcript_65134/m.181090 type:complete len:292 (-) Transcript_65134:41-916(-)
MSGDVDAVSAVERAISALVGYSCGAAVVLPFDRVKSLMQVSEAGRQKGALGLARSILTTHGLRGLYKGGLPHMLIAPYTVFYYSCYDELLGRSGGHPLAPLGAAVVARTVETSIRMPLELLRTQMQTADNSVKMTSCLGTMWRQPPSSWFRGMVPTLLRDVPFSAIYWFAYEQAKGRVRVPESLVRQESLRTFLQSFCSGAAAGMLAAVLLAPMDVIKTVRQHRLEAGLASSYSQILRSIRERPAIAFAGVGPRLVRIPAGLATMMASLEVTRRSFEQRRKRQREMGEAST